MPRNAADFLVETLIDWGIDTIFGLPGDGINGVMEAIRTRQDKLRFIQVRHEETAAFMACAHAKWTGRIGCCLATSGPGGIHLLNGLYDAKLDRAPVLAITGLQYHDMLESFTQQDVDLDKLFQDVSIYNTRIMSAAHIGKAVELACRSALARRGVAHLTLPVDVQEETLEEASPSPRNKPHPAGMRAAEGLLLPRPEDLDRAAALLNDASRVAILAGRGALGATAELERCADLLGAPVAKALLGKAVMADDHALTTGGIGLYGTFGTHRAMAGCDALLIIGSTFPYVEYYPQPGQARAVQIDRDAQHIGLRHPAEVGLVGDAKAVLEELNARLKRKADRSFLADCQKEARRWREVLAAGLTPPRTPMHPGAPLAVLSRRLTADAVVVTDSGHNTGLTARYLDLGPSHAFGVSGLLASMSCGLPYAMAAALAFPGRPVFAVVGDGGLAMQLGELATAVRYRLPVKLLVIKNNTLGQIKWEQILFLGNPEYECDLQPIDFAKAAEAVGAQGFSVSEPGALEERMQAWMAAPGPAVLEVAVDPNEPLLPAVVSETYRKHLEKALEAGTAGAEALKAALRRLPAKAMMEAK
ncbi:thiamine pyrophosphate-dependent enzyme [Siccirubricoccus sp. KC 17139]|uniref:Thiamine pyrophosphate-dependent enzyme n=1 Tax=Siccirubricoccus soli TaxID=2899147 RepID=A0ABT1D359_9PROT|nr:thiamine pyrophosphate-dependent enzyme [Siccirubricoccus soli]MCO6416337.1 thiamine pyrophosphate-dependent enzyme [Siccirubricoccus soli]MCP2682471.1 thiamine pyrophosphate-binding protein [Siccirubricoccus soli]